MDSRKRTQQQRRKTAGIGNHVGSARTWIGGRFSPPAYVMDGEPFRVDLLVLLELPDELVVGMEMSSPMKPHTFSDVLQQTMKKPLVGPPRRPTLLRVEDPALAAEVRAQVPDLVVEIGETPALHEFTAKLRESVAGMGEELTASYFEDGRVTLPDLQRLFAAAEALYQVEPWLLMHDEQVLRLDIPALSIDGAAVSITGALGETIGFVIFPSLPAFQSFLRFAQRPRGLESLDLGTSVLSLTFEAGEDLPPSMRREVMSYGLPIADAQAYPIVEHRDRDGVPRPGTAHDVQVATACATALTRFMAKHADAIVDEEDAQISETYVDDQQREIRLSFPHRGSTKQSHRRSFAEPTRHSEPKPSRNGTCPCGSGKKYKKCCLAKDEEAARSAKSAVGGPNSAGFPSGVANVHRIEEPLIPKLFSFARSQFPDALTRASDDFDDPETSLQLFGPWLFFGIEVDGKTLVEHYVEAHGHSLTTKERALLLTQPTAWLSIWEVTEVVPGHSILLKDLLSGEERLVREVTASRSVNKREALLGRVLDFEGESVIAGLHPRTLPPKETMGVVARARTKLRRKTAVPVDRLRSESLGRFLIRAWEESVREFAMRSQLPPKLQNTDGDTLLLTRDHFSFDPAKSKQLDRCLRAIPNVDPPDSQGEPYVFLRPGNSMHKDWETTIVGRGTITRGELTLETNSIRRADVLRKLVESSCQGLLTHRLREHSDPAALLANRDALPALPTELPPAEVDAVIRQYKANHYARWVDEPVPALGGKTPRQAVRSKAGREQVDVLLKGIEHNESRLPGGPQVDLSSIRAELGLT